MSENQRSGELVEAVETPRSVVAIARLANILLLIGQFPIVFPTGGDEEKMRAGYTKLLAGFLLILAAYIEARNTDQAENVTERGRQRSWQKVIGAVISTAGAIILIDVLQREISKGIVDETPTLAPFLGVGAIGN